ncbi:outer membrane lipoprotein-sorting protein [Desulfocurvus vexinensis]|uniref:outer membrane lipoprotein-sorting protein n=1 Tax=Desulfocurvus vexinensis TaxID=399548 RepID=UPI00048F70A5|nr:outer membrane lipoprotein-sorting protein [Desulfocurvus vexinensis]
MHSTIIAAFAACLFLALGPAPALADAKAEGRAILERQRDLHETSSATSTVVMILADNAGNKKQREFKTWKKTMDDGLARTLMAFTAPADLAGTALLSWETGDGQAKQWLYMPATGKMQRVASSSKADFFMGTDFTYEDMEPDDLDQYDMTLTGSAELDGQDCHIVEVTPATEAKAKESGYGKRVFYVRKDITFTVKIEYHDPRGRLVKVQTAHDLENVRGQMWIARKTLMNNLRAKHQTLMGLAAFEVDAAIDDAVFTERYVMEGRPLQ